MDDRPYSVTGTDIKNRKMAIDIEKTKKIVVTILQEISKFIDEGVELITFDDIRRNIDYIPGDPRRLSSNIWSMERRGYIKINRILNNSIQLTNKGKIKLIEESGNYAIDGKWRMLSFDIPEDFRKKRNQFRRSIKRIGYKQAQKSLWVSPFVKADEIELIISEQDLGKFVAYLLVEKTDMDSYLKSLFKTELSQKK